MATRPDKACATLLLTKDIHPKIVSEVLGHSSIPLDTYSHVIPGLGEVTPSTIEDLLRNDTDVSRGVDRGTPSDL